MLHEDLLNAVDFLAILAENGCELLNHLVSENMRRIDPLEFLQHVQGCFG